VVVGIDHLLIQQVARQPDLVAAGHVRAEGRFLQLDLVARQVFVAAPGQKLRLLGVARGDRQRSHARKRLVLAADDHPSGGVLAARRT